MASPPLPPKKWNRRLIWNPKIMYCNGPSSYADCSTLYTNIIGVNFYCYSLIGDFYVRSWTNKDKVWKIFIIYIYIYIYISNLLVTNFLQSPYTQCHKPVHSVFNNSSLKTSNPHLQSHKALISLQGFCTEHKILVWQIQTGNHDHSQLPHWMAISENMKPDSSLAGLLKKLSVH